MSGAEVGLDHVGDHTARVEVDLLKMLQKYEGSSINSANLA